MGLLDEDRLMRMIRQLVEGLLRARALRTSGRDELADSELGELLERLLGLKASLVYASSPETLLSLLSPAGRPDLEKLVIAGRLLEERAALLESRGQSDEATWHVAQALVLLEEARAIDSEGHYADHYEGLEALSEKLG